MTRVSALIFHFSKEIKVIENNDEFSGVHGGYLKQGKVGWLKPWKPSCCQNGHFHFPV